MKDIRSITLLALAVVTITTAGCSKSDQITDVNEMKPIDIACTVELTDHQTKAPIIGTDMTEQFWIMRGPDRNGSDPVSFPIVPASVNKTVVTPAKDGNGKVTGYTWGAIQYFPVSATFKTAQFQGYYPPYNSIANENSKLVLKYTIDGSQDIMVGKAPSFPGYGNPVALNFVHKLAMIEVQLKAATAADLAAFGTISNVRVRQFLNSKVQIGMTDQGEWDADISLQSTPGNSVFTMLPMGSSVAISTDEFVSVGSVMIYPPDSPLVDAISIKTANNSSLYSYYLSPSLPTLEAGKRYIIKGVLSGRAIDFKCTVADWKTGTDTNANVD